MKILAIDTTGNVASVAIVDDFVTIAECSTNLKKTHSQTIMPMIDYICKLTDFDMKTIDYIACGKGPGSFTGLRIGASCAKGLAMALDKLIVPVSTLDALAYNIFNTENIICPIMDAKRNEVYTSFFYWNNGNFERISDYMAINISDVLDQAMTLKKNDKKVIFVGDGIFPYEEMIKEKSVDFVIAPQNCNLQRGASVGALASIRTNEAVSSQLFELTYLRKSQAEREKEEKRSK